MNMQITDLNTAVELDRAALIEVFGAGTYGWRHRVSSSFHSKYSSKISTVRKGNKAYRVRKFFRVATRVIKQTSKRKVLTGMQYL